jgi:hypothetical protein
MKTKVTIAPVGANDQMLSGIYHTLEGKVRVLVGETNYKELTQYEYEKEKPKELSFTFSKKGMIKKDYLYEADPEKQDSTDRNTQQVVEVFWAQHPQFIVNGVATKYTKVQNFNVSNEVDLTVLNHKLWSDKLSIINRINSMSEDTKRDVAYFYGLSPVGKSENDLCLLLAEFNTGICLKEKKEGSSVKSYMDLFLSVWMKDSDTERTYVVNARKAITMGIFLNTQTDGRDNYYYGQTFIGNAFNDVLAFCKREGRIYEENIVREINARENKKIKEAKKEEAAAKPKEVDANSEVLRNEIRAYVKDGSLEPIKGLHLMSVEKMISVIDEVKSKKALATA